MILGKSKPFRELMIGRKFDSLIITSVNKEKTINNRTYFNCLCECGTTCTKRSDQLTGKTKEPKSCGCRYDKKKQTMDKNEYRLLGMVVGHLKVLSVDEKRTLNSKRVYYLAQCSCGNVVSKRSDFFASAHSSLPKSCGCMNKVDLTNKVYGRLTVIKELPPRQFKSGTNRDFYCSCECGSFVNVTDSNLYSGAITNCGKCFEIDLTGEKRGNWLVLEKTEPYTSPSGHRMKQYLCRCECGFQKKITQNRLRSDDIGGCLKCSLTDLSGETFGLLTAIKKTGTVFYPSGQSSEQWLCQCACGNLHTVTKKTLGKGGTQSCGCSKISKGERRIREVLDDLSIKYVSEYRINECKNKRPLPFDFAVFDKENKLVSLIEYDGAQHFKSIVVFEGEIGFESRKRNDKTKDDYCKQNNLPLLRISYLDFENIEKILTEVFVSRHSTSISIPVN